MRRSCSEPHIHDDPRRSNSPGNCSPSVMAPVQQYKRSDNGHLMSGWDDDGEVAELMKGMRTPTADSSPGQVSTDGPHTPSVTWKADDATRRQVLVLCTGGTMTMALDKDGSLAPVKGSVGRYMDALYELKEPKMPMTTLVEYDPLLDSSDMGPREWARIAADVEKNYLHFDGFVVITGTDTMAYAASALSFMLENLGKPVIFTGSQIPICEAHNDARRNLIASILFAGRDTFPEVMIFFDDKLLRGCRSVKMDTHGLSAFISPNLAPLATLGVTINERADLVRPPPRAPLQVHLRVETRVLVVRLVPGFDDAFLRRILCLDDESAASNGGIQQLDPHKHLKALIIELYGCGNLPTAKKSFIDTLAFARKRGILVVATSQCAVGGVVLGKYAVGKALGDAGVVSAGDMTTEAASTKLGYLLGRGDLSLSQIEKLVGTSLRGELSPPELLTKPVFPSTPARAVA